MDLGNSRAIVTGGASGLGAATVDWFRSQGATVVVLDREAGTGAHHVQADVTSADSTAAAIAQAVGIMGGIDICVNCAGVVTGERTVGRNGPHDLDAFRRVIEVNLVGSFNVLRLAAAEMARNGRAENGVIVNTASIAAFDGQKGQAAYAASKAGIAGMTLPLARDLAGLNIRVCAIAPGIFATPMLRGLPQDVQDSLAAEVTFPARLGDPQEFARMAAHIVENAYLNGEVIRLDGALRMR
ncbi:SDR family NAD(P)-dependent oxidoreductase [Paracoccus sp. AK26]|uniref:SDR family NAD(P)-dependent oxidoreductase n=1 Tax=Paracoccus sp. AK26 TaxID=2589076 RepID=UPI0014286FFD|nr:SDR family NAD(P)-dependent oxidoreductase [Paracoccus sp. AK26]QIR84745.1 SDR family NAD(P)-dependent oxidoreductase [Paracoccus sp. AK26]